jgi:quercetin dioxygenase-like cupin family protein
MLQYFSLGTFPKRLWQTTVISKVSGLSHFLMLKSFNLWGGVKTTPINSMKLETHKDKRGIIKDLMVGKDFSVTYISFKKGAVRGNHLHKKTFQNDIIISGLLIDEEGEKWGETDDKFIHPDTPHAYKALEDSEMISICFGKRIGKNYSKDTYALQTPLIPNN